VRKVPVDDFVFGVFLRLISHLLFAPLARLLRMLEAKDMIATQDDARTRVEDFRLGDLSAVDVDKRFRRRNNTDNSIVVLEAAMLLQNVRARQLDVLRCSRLRCAELCDAILDVVQQALGQRWILVEVDQVRRHFGTENSNRDAVRLHSDSHFRKDRFALLTNLISSLQLLLPRLVELRNQLLAGVQLIHSHIRFGGRCRAHRLVTLVRWRRLLVVVINCCAAAVVVVALVVS